MTQLYVSRGKYSGYEVIGKESGTYEADANLSMNGNNIDIDGGNILLGGGDLSEVDDIGFNADTDRNITNSASTMQIEVETGAVVDININNTDEYTFTSTTLDMHANILSEVALIQGDTTTNDIDDTTSGWIIDGPTSLRIAIASVNQMQIADGNISLEDCFVDMQEQSAPSAPASNTGRLYMKDNGAGKTQYVVKFNTGAEQVIATQP